MKGSEIESITLFVDSQAFHSWMLTNKTPKRNTFINNRLQEISSFFSLYRLTFLPNLVLLNFFLRILVLGVKGPSWLNSLSEEYPKGLLGCILSNVMGDLISPVMFPNKEPLVNISNFSSFFRLISIASKFFTAVYKFKRVKLTLLGQLPVTL